MIDDDMRYAVVILDGASGEPLEEYAGLTTLEVAETPHLDALAAQGLVGLARNVPDGLEPSSNVACTSIVGYNPADYPIGRGALELSALGVDLGDDQIALRVNLTNVTPEGVMHSYSTDNISNEDGHALGDELIAAFEAASSAGGALKLYKGTGFRLYLVVTGRPGLMATELAAAHNIADLPVADYPPRGPEARFIEDFEALAKEVLAASPVNARRIAEGKLPATDVFAFWPGMRPGNMEDFTSIYGKRAAMNSGVDLLNGIAQLAGIRRYHFDGVTDGPDNDYAAQGEGALAMLEDNEVAFIHVEAPDAEGHDGNAAGKRRAVEAIDREVISRLRAFGATHPLRILALPDHPTPVATKRHTREPVPFVMAGPGIATNGVTRLTEAEAKATGLLVDPGYRLLGALLGTATLK
ncbi:MAG: 2,3-bisphosphoglycerate-independent phosphoglycerate mutase [Coriobacteriales bacterium]|jgi:2,3-bisphosphoglycerate-independent phosphoglycerate mutase|nr:2,3-bisphosphoglycerate-independent phosphoglycerate mutase [Coriobacteriales bacterium]